MLIHLAVGRLDVVDDGLQDRGEDAALLVAEERAERVGARAKVLIQQTNDLGQVRLRKGLDQIMSHGLVSLEAQEHAVAAGDVMVAKVEHAKAQRRGLPGNLRGN